MGAKGSIGIFSSVGGIVSWTCGFVITPLSSIEATSTTSCFKGKIGKKSLKIPWIRTFLLTSRVWDVIYNYVGFKPIKYFGSKNRTYLGGYTQNE